MADNCKYLNYCPVYQGKLADKEGMKKIFKRRYCEGDYSNCARYQIASTIGESHVPEGLLPNQNEKAKEVLENYFKGLYYSLYEKVPKDNIRFVEKSVENAEFAFELYSMYPKAKFIHIIRNPYSNIVSFRKFKSIQKGYPLINRVLKSFYNDYYFLYKNSNLLDNYLIVSYEDLVTKPKAEMTRIADHLEIKFDDILLKPTHLGVQWEGNSMTSKPFKGIDQSRLHSWKNEIHSMEMYYINKLFPFVFDDINYTKLSNKKGFLKPVKGENLKRYIYNRLYYIYCKI